MPFLVCQLNPFHSVIALVVVIVVVLLFATAQPTGQTQRPTDANQSQTDNAGHSAVLRIKSVRVSFYGFSACVCFVCVCLYVLCVYVYVLECDSANKVGLEHSVTDGSQ